jgi:formylglycine-generating enzyme required for sulfatase activity
MHHLLTGIEPLPFRFESLRKINFKISTELENIVMKALKDNLHERFSSAKEMKEALVNLSIPLQIKAKLPPVIMPSQINQIVPPTKDLYRVPPIQKFFIEPEMVYINGGTFQMGSINEKPIHSVTVSGFYLSIYTVTNKEYCLYETSHENPGDNLPAVEVSWDDAVSYCRWLSSKTGSNYRLPTEAEWEYACRAGTTTKYYWGNKIDGSYCWYYDNSGGGVHPVGQKISNGFGLYDMSGNIWEWCSDWYGDYSSSSVTNPIGSGSGSFRVLRGGGWYGIAGHCRSAYRISNSPVGHYDYVGFRLSRTP